MFGIRCRIIQLPEASCFLSLEQRGCLNCGRIVIEFRFHLSKFQFFSSSLSFQVFSISVFHSPVLFLYPFLMKPDLRVKKRIPYAVANFEQMREENYYFVDKTKYIQTLEDYTAPVFLRPRRFGKTLWCSILECYYDINRAHKFDALFGGTYIGENPTPEKSSMLVMRFNFSVVSVSDNGNEIKQSFDGVCEGAMNIFLTRYAIRYIDSEVNVKMVAGILGEKLGMTRIFAKNGESIPVTVILAGPCQVIQKKTIEKDGYNAVQLGFKEVKEKKVSKPIANHLSKYKVKPIKYIREFKVIDSNKYSSGAELRVDIFKEGDKVDIVGISKGKGFAGAIKRHNFSGGPKTHGQKEYFRSVGSIGATDAARVFKGQKLPGHMGADRVTVKNIEVVKIDLERNLILVRGSVPGAKGAILAINKNR